MLSKEIADLIFTRQCHALHRPTHLRIAVTSTASLKVLKSFSNSLSVVDSIAAPVNIFVSDRNRTGYCSYMNSQYLYMHGFLFWISCFVGRGILSIAFSFISRILPVSFCMVGFLRRISLADDKSPGICCLPNSVKRIKASSID